MKKTILFILLIGVFGFFCEKTFACSCIGLDFGYKTKADYKKWSDNFPGAVFAGEVLEIERVESNNLIKVKFKVNRYWKGVKGAEIIIYTTSGGYGVSYKKGKTYFVVAQNYKNRLVTSVCVVILYGGFEKHLGKWKTPKKKNGQ